MTSFTVKDIETMESLHHGAVKLAAAELGIESFGMQLLEFPPGFDGYPEHDHSDDQMEEVYVVLRGSGEFEIDGETVPVDGNRMVRVDPGARRRLTPGGDGISVLAIGCTRGRPYERPADFELGARA